MSYPSAGGTGQGQGKGAAESTGGACAEAAGSLDGKGLSPSPEESQGADIGKSSPGTHTARTPEEAKEARNRRQQRIVMTSLFKMCKYRGLQDAMVSSQRTSPAWQAPHNHRTIEADGAQYINVAKPTLMSQRDAYYEDAFQTKMQK